jgi:predicted nuclease of predicted toxin-antitoxin system
MPKPATKLHFFLDNNVPDSIGRFLQRSGHSVQRQRFNIPADSPDPVVAMTALKAGRILVTQDKDFNSQRFQQDRFAGLSRVSLSGVSTTLLPALKEHLHLIEFQWAHCQRSGAARMVAFVKLGNVRFKT